MPTRIADALSAYSNAAARGLAQPGMEARNLPPGQSFGELLRDAAQTSLEAGRASERVSAEALVGRADLNDVVMAVNNAEVTLQTVVTLRDKVIEAYQEIIRMPI